MSSASARRFFDLSRSLKRDLREHRTDDLVYQRRAKHDCLHFRADAASEPRQRDLRHPAPKKPKGKGSFMGRFMHVSESLRRPAESSKALILVKNGVLEMVEDIEDALVNGQSVLIDFEREDRNNMKEAATKLINFIHMHRGAYYTVTRTSLLLSLSNDAVIEWRPGPAEE